MRTSLMPRISLRLKNNIFRTRTAVMAFRIIQFVGALLALTMMILIKAPTNTAIVWCMRIAPGVSALHCLYAIYHLARKPSGRTPASSASYMLFASTFDVAVIAFYVLGGYTAFYEWDPQNIKDHDPEEQWTTWSTILHDAAPNTDIAGIFKMCVTLAFCVTGFFHLITLGLSIWLFQMFRKIVKLPPDANPLEDNLTSRMKHKRNKSSIALSESTWDDDGKSARFSQYTQNTNRYSGSVHQDYRPPSIPFMHTRTGSSSSVGSHTEIPVGTSPRDSRMDLPSRTYGIPHGAFANNSQVDLKRQSMASVGDGSQSPPKRGSYAAVPQAGEQQWMSQSDRETRKANYRKSMPNIAGKSTRAAPLGGGSPVRAPRPLSNYGSRYGRYDSGNDSGNDSDIGSSVVSRMTDPLKSHPVRPVGQNAKQALSPQRIAPPTRESALSQMTLNRMNTVKTQASSVYSTDELGNPSASDLSQTKKFDGDDLEELEREREAKRWAGQGEGRQLTPSPKKNRGNAYSELRNSGMGEVPQLVGRNVSTGNDLGMQKGYRREVSGAVAEEGRGGPASGWGARFRKVSGLGQAQ